MAFAAFLQMVEVILMGYTMIPNDEIHCPVAKRMVDLFERVEISAFIDGPGAKSIAPPDAVFNDESDELCLTCRYSKDCRGV